jgi:hypothetical protein
MEASLLASAGVSTTTMAVLFLAYKAFMSMKGHRLVSDCCGKKAEVGFDVKDMPPSPPAETQNHRKLPPKTGERKESLSVEVQEPTTHQKEIETA